MSTVKGHVRVDLVNRSDGRLEFMICPTTGIGKYFKVGRRLVVQYAADVDGLDDSVLYIPAVANLAPVAWAVGADLEVPALDATFLRSLRTIKGVMHGMYSDFSFAGDVRADKVRANRFGRSGSAQLFTGGIDSLATYLRHRDEKPALITYGIFTPYDRRLQRLIFDRISEFAHKEGVAFHPVESNMNDFFNQKNLLRDYGENLPLASWWASVQHGLGLLGMCAPVTAAFDIQRLYIASTATQNTTHMAWKAWGSHPGIDNNVAWAGVRVDHDGTELTRQEKIRHSIGPFFQAAGEGPVIVCNEPYRGRVLNCGRCEKCYRTILGLVLEDIDPNRCGLPVDGRTFDDIRRRLLDKNADLISGNPNMWRDIQAAGPPATDLYGSKQFFEWFRGHRIPDHVHTKSLFRDIRKKVKDAFAPIPGIRALGEIPAMVSRINKK